MRSTPELTAEQEAQAQELAAQITAAIASDVLSMARLLVSKDARHTFGQTEFQLRAVLHKAGAKALETSLDQKKTATTARP
jgi:phosphomannomutase